MTDNKEKQVAIQAKMTNLAGKLERSIAQGLTDFTNKNERNVLAREIEELKLKLADLKADALAALVIQGEVTGEPPVTEDAEQEVQLIAAQTLYNLYCDRFEVPDEAIPAKEILRDIARLAMDVTFYLGNTNQLYGDLPFDGGEAEQSEG